MTPRTGRVGGRDEDPTPASAILAAPRTSHSMVQILGRAPRLASLSVVGPHSPTRVLSSLRTCIVSTLRTRVLSLRSTRYRPSSIVMLSDL